MPLDGLSFSNSGLYRITTPMEIAIQTEQAAQAKAEMVVKQPDANERTKLDPDDGDENNSNYSGRDTSDEEEEDSNNQDDSLQKKKSIIKKYKVKFNPHIDMVELVDQNTGLIIETISPEDLVNLISKSKGASGILVDREV